MALLNSCINTVLSCTVLPKFILVSVHIQQQSKPYTSLCHLCCHFSLCFLSMTSARILIRLWVCVCGASWIEKGLLKVGHGTNDPSSTNPELSNRSKQKQKRAPESFTVHCSTNQHKPQCYWAINTDDDDDYSVLRNCLSSEHFSFFPIRDININVAGKVLAAAAGVSNSLHIVRLRFVHYSLRLASDRAVKLILS